MTGKIREPQRIEKNVNGSICCNDGYVCHSDEGRVFHTKGNAPQLRGRLSTPQACLTNRQAPLPLTKMYITLSETKSLIYAWEILRSFLALNDEESHLHFCKCQILKSRSDKDRPFWIAILVLLNFHLILISICHEKNILTTTSFTTGY